jgi:hypothetical protein
MKIKITSDWYLQWSECMQAWLPVQDFEVLEP